MTCDQNGGDGPAHGSKPGRRAEVDRMVGRQIAALRTAKGMTIEEFRNSLDISAEMAAEIESGTIRPNSAMLIDIARVLDCGPTDLFKRP
jgi:transcriptional regulator with XRE-family HTH domain